jgi:hypothetical protein
VNENLARVTKPRCGRRPQCRPEALPEKLFCRVGENQCASIIDSHSAAAAPGIGEIVMTQQFQIA